MPSRAKPNITLFIDWWTLLKGFSAEQVGRIVIEAYNVAMSENGETRSDNFEDDPEIRVMGQYLIEQIIKRREKDQQTYDQNRENAKRKNRNDNVTYYP